MIMTKISEQSGKVRNLEKIWGKEITANINSKDGKNFIKIIISYYSK
jgi:hypothetical protein